MNAIEQVTVWLDEGTASPVKVGDLRPSFQGGRTLASSSFQYDTEYLRQRGRYALSPDLPLTSTRVYTPENQQLFGAFSDAAPDEWGRKLIQANHAQRLNADTSLPRRIGDFDYLIGVSDRTRMGSLRLMDSSGEWLSADEGVANTHDLPRILRATERYEANEATDADVEYLNSVATSPGGARPKANLVLENGELAIAKLPHSRDGELDIERWEALALALAEACGIRVPSWFITSSGPHKSVLVLTRFDRDFDVRRGYMSAATAMEMGRFDDQRLTYEDFSDTIAEVSSNPRADLEEMFTRIALFVLINNVDDHWRNHGFTHTASGWRLAPAFDVNPSPRRNVIDSRSISANDDPRNRDVTNLVRISSRFQLDDARGAEIVSTVASRVNEWRTAAEEIGLDRAQIALMERAFDQTQLDRAMAAA